ncbi:MAG: hypothetical protein V7K64_02440 [Nostoc sp.]|uniref:hypothetical protein n=1 Tax=uncultured Nostoc sp. TaxID=340711 RepID=UPI0035C9EA21
MCNSVLTPHSLETVGRIALDTTRDGGIVATVSATVSGSPRRCARSQQLRFIRRL